MMKIAKIVSWHYQYNEQYFVEIDLHCGVFEVWLWRMDIGIKDLLFGVFSNENTYDEVVDMAEHYISDNKCIEFYENEYVNIE